MVHDRASDSSTLFNFNETATTKRWSPVLISVSDRRQKPIGSRASALLLIGIHPAFRRLQAVGAVIAFAVMSGAVNFHLWTPLGIDPNQDGGGLFFMAVVVWLTSLGLIIVRRKELAAILAGLKSTLFPPRS